MIGGYTEEAAAGAAPEEALPTFGEPEPAAEPLPTFGESEPLPTFGEPEPMGMNGMGGGLGAEFAAAPEPDCEAVVQWRAATDARLAAKAAEEESAVAAKKAQAQKDLEQFYAERDAKVKARVAVNREEEKQYVAERDDRRRTVESVAKMVNLGGGRRDTTRMRNVLIGLKRVIAGVLCASVVCERATTKTHRVTSGRDAKGGDKTTRRAPTSPRHEGSVVEERRRVGRPLGRDSQ